MDIVVLTCLGTVPGRRVLCGDVWNAGVSLAPQIGGPFSGTRWARFVEAGRWILECMAEDPRSHNFYRLLAGRTHVSMVDLQKDVQNDSVRWQAHPVEGGVTLELVTGIYGSAQPAPGRWFLDGRTHDGTVGLAPHTDPPFTGTHWRVGAPID
jgi:hypothetical protein